MTRRTESRRVVGASTGGRVLEQSRVRLWCVGVCFLLCFVSLQLRLVEMMIRSPGGAPTLVPTRSEGAEPEDADVSPHAALERRGDIVDRNGVVLATSLLTASAYANAKEIRNPEDAAARLSRAVGMAEAPLLKRLKSKKSFVWIKRNLTPREQQAMNDLGIPGVYFQDEERRVYPYGNLLAHTVGYVDVDNQGLAGVEKQFNRELADGVPGHTPLALSVDVRLQHILRDEMQKAVQEFQAIGAAGVIADVKTGEILAMSSLPDFDPHKPARAVDEQKFNRVTLGTYEMGSTFKSFTMAMALDAGTTTLRGGYDASHPFKFATFTISDSHPKARWLSVPEIFAYSSNIGTARMMLDAGVKRQRAFMEKVGMLEPVALELPERAQPLFPKEWKELSAITISYGHGISVTPLHLVRGISTLVGGGVMHPLTLLKDHGGKRAEGDRVISEKTSAQMARLMRLVVTHGTGSKANVAGYRVGGKTGTAEKITAGGGYSKGNNLSSFVGVFPVDDPAYALLIMVDEPRGTKASFGNATGGWVAAPAAGRVIARMAPLLGLPPSYDKTRDDAEQYWVDTEKRGVATVAARNKPKDRFVHAASY